MKRYLSILPRWLTAVLLMLIIFLVSSRTSSELPNFRGWDYFIKKSSHAIGYGLLALSYLHALGHKEKNYWLAWLFAILYAATDEIHQSFVPGRTPRVTDVLIFDNFGAMIALCTHFWYQRKKNQEEK